MVAGSVVVVVVAAADSHIWAYIWGGGGTWRLSPRGPPEAEGHAPPRDGGKEHGATGRGEDLVAGSVVVMVVAAADSHIWAYI